MGKAQSPMKQQQSCAACKVVNRSAKLRQCSRCTSITSFYCSQACKLEHWRLDHKASPVRLKSLSVGSEECLITEETGMLDTILHEDSAVEEDAKEAGDTAPVELSRLNDEHSVVPHEETQISLVSAKLKRAGAHARSVIIEGGESSLSYQNSMDLVASILEGDNVAHTHPSFRCLCSPELMSPSSLTGILSAGVSIPVIGSACEVLLKAVRIIASTKKFIKDVANAGLRVLEAIDYLNFIPSILCELDEHDGIDLINRVDSLRISSLDLLSAIEQMYQPGFLRRLAFRLLQPKSGNKTIAEADHEIERALNGLRAIVSLTAERTMLKKITSLSATLNESICPKVTFPFTDSLALQVQDAVKQRGLLTPTEAIEALVASPEWREDGESVRILLHEGCKSIKEDMGVLKESVLAKLEFMNSSFEEGLIRLGHQIATSPQKRAKSSSPQKCCKVQHRKRLAKMPAKSAIIQSPQSAALSPVAQLYQDALDFKSAGLQLESISLLRRLLKDHDKFHTSAWFTLGFMLDDIGDTSGAVEALKSCTELDPCNAVALSNLGLLYQQLGNTLQAESTFREALDASCNDVVTANIYFNLGVLFHHTACLDMAKAEASYRDCLKFNPLHVRALNNLGVLSKCKFKLLPAAEYLYREALEIEPDYAPARWNLSLLLESKGLIRGALTELRKISHASEPGISPRRALKLERGGSKI